MNFKKWLPLFALTSVCLWTPQLQAQDYPNKPITMVMPYAAGGPGDTITRLFAGSMQKILGQQILVDNTAGASGAIGTAKVARARPPIWRCTKISVITQSTILSPLAPPPAAPWSSWLETNSHPKI
jgi:tripartite-type tricarboxylate transporter receptor subunit TctC